MDMPVYTLENNELIAIYKMQYKNEFYINEGE